MSAVSVLIADTQRLLAESLVVALSERPELVPIEQVALTGSHAVELARQLRPDVVVLDQWISGLDSVAATTAIREHSPASEVIVVSGLPGPPQVQAAFAAGAAGYLPKSAGLADLTEAVVRVHRGEAPVFLEQLSRLVDSINQQARLTEMVETGLAGLSEREQEVVRLLVEGRSVRDLPGLLFITEGTMRNYLHKIQKKTGARTPQDLLRLARMGAPEAQGGAGAVQRRTDEPPGEGIAVLVADEQRLFAECLTGALAGMPGIQVVGTCWHDGVQALHAAIRMAPNVFVCDYWMPATSGRAVARYLSRWAPGTHVVFLSWLHGAPQVADAASAGAAGLVSKKVSLAELASCIQDAAAERPLEHAATLSRRHADTRCPPSHHDGLIMALSPRELHVLQYIGQGRSFHEIGRELEISAGTAKNHLSSVLRKTGSRSRLEAVEMARRSGYVREPGAPPN